jgi:hypothetical protein
MAKRPVAFECPPGDVKDVLGTCTDFNPSYNTHRLEGRYTKVFEERLLKVVRKITGLTSEQFDLQTPLEKLFRGKKAIEDMQKAMKAAGKAPAPNVDLQLLLKQGRLRDLLPKVSPEEVYKEHTKRCSNLVGDEDAFRAEGCKRRAHILLPAGRWSFQNLGAATPTEVERGKKGEKKSVIRSKVEMRQRLSRLQKDGPPLDARTQAPGSRRDFAPFEERLESLAGAISDGLTTYAKEGGTRLPRTFNIPWRAAPLVAAGVPAPAAELIVRQAGGKKAFFRGSPRTLSDGLSKLFGGATLRFSADWKHQKESHPHFSVTKACSNCFGTGELEFTRNKERYAKKCPTCHGSGQQGLDIRRFRSGSRGAVPFLRNVIGQQASIDRKVVYLRALSILPPDKAEVPLPVDFESWPEAADAAFRGAPAASKVRIRIGTKLEMYDVHRNRLPDEVTLEMQHSELLEAAAPVRPTDYAALEQFPVPEIAQIVARKLLSPRKKRKGRAAKDFNPTLAQNNPLPTYTLNAADLQGPAFLFRSPKAGDVPVDDGLGHMVPEHEGPMGPGMYKPYAKGAGKYIFWGTKKGADAKVVSKERLESWLRVAEKGALISSSSKHRPKLKAELEILSATALANPRPPRYTKPLQLSTSAGSKNMANDYFPGPSIWDFYENGEFGPNTPQPLGRRNPAARKVSKAPRKAPRKTTSALGLAWHHEFGRMAATVMADKAVKTALTAAWEHVYPADQRAALHDDWIAAHKEGAAPGAKSNPRAGFEDYPRENLYSYVQGDYGFDPRFGNVPVNRRNPAPQKRSKVTAARSGGTVQYARFPSVCHKCGETFVTQRAAAVQSGLASQIVDSGERGPKGGIKMVHAHCAK